MSGQFPPPYNRPTVSPSRGYPTAYSPPPRRDNSRIVALVIAVLVVGGAGIAVWYGLQIALKNQQIQSQTSRIQSVYTKGVVLYQAGHFLEAAPLFQKVRLDPASGVEMITKAAEAEAFCYRMLGQQAQEAKDYTAAEQWFQQAVSVAPNDISAQEELRAVQKAIAILTGKDTLGGPLPSGSHSGNLDNNNPTPTPTPNAADEAAKKRARDAQEIFERGNQLLREGHRNDACREWHEAILLAPGSPAAVQATQRRRENCSDFPNFGG
jgi:tetratricopeptide (TPR) repeat protein